MRKYSYTKVDAFTSGLSAGNPAAFLDLGTDTLTEPEMLKIAKEHQGFVSEMIFLTRKNTADFHLTYYSSECEVSFCGHGTIATMYEIIQNNEELRTQTELTIITNKKGPLAIINNISTDDAIYITAPKSINLEIPVSKAEVAQALGIIASKIAEHFPLDFIDAGLRTLIVPIAKLSDEISIFPDKDVLEHFCMKKGIDTVLIFSKEVSDPRFFAHTRVFAPKYGYLEDPATGSGNSAFGNYLIKNNLWKTESIAIEQGGNTIVYNEIKLLKKGDAVLFGGRATKKIEGVYFFN